MQKITRPAFILLLFSVFILIFSSERHILAQAAWRLDADPAAIMPHHFRIDKELQIAGGSQPVPAALRSLPEALGCNDGTSLWIIDLRQESHGFLNGAAVSWHTEKNAANRGLQAAEVERRERQQLAAVLHTEVIATPMGNADRKAIAAPFAATVSDWATERHLARTFGYGYQRFAATDMSWPEPQAIDDFVAFYRSLPQKHGWLFFHCPAGPGRTTTFMTLYELLEIPGISAAEAAAHQKALGGADLVQTGYLPELEQFSMYIKDTRGQDFVVSWSQWLTQHSTPSR